jgi:hypothetical protein
MKEITKNTISNSENKIKVNASRESLSNGVTYSTTRKDVYGNMISKKMKKHKISFADELESEKQLTEIITVASYRVFNKIEDQGKTTNNF